MSQDINIRLNLQTAQALEKMTEFVAVAGAELLGFLGIAAGFRGLEQLAHHSLELAENMQKLSARTGESVESLAGLTYAADASQVSSEALTRSLRKFADWQVKAGEGNRSVIDGLLKQSEIFSRLPDGIGKTSLAIERFGRTGDQLIPLLNKGPEAIQEMINRGEILSGVTEEMAHAAHEGSIAWKEFHLALESFVGTIAAKLLPLGTRVLEWMTSLSVDIRLGLQMLMGGGPLGFLLGGIGKGIESATEKITEKKKDGLELDKQAYEEKKKDLELQIQIQEMLQKEEQQRVSAESPEERLRHVNAAIDEQIKLRRELYILEGKAHSSGVTTFDQSTTGQLKQQGAIDKLQQQRSPATLGGDIRNAFLNLQMETKPIFQQIADTLVHTIGTAINTISQNITGLILGTKTWAQALRSIATTILSTVIDAIIQMALKWIWAQLTTWLFGKTLQTASIAVAATTAAGLSAAWSTPATLSTIASYGASAEMAPGLIAVAEGITLAQATPREFGGPVSAGSPYIVGERRPELFIPSQNGVIVPQVSTGASGTSIHVHNWNDAEAMNQHLRNNPEAHHVILDKVKRNAHVIGRRT